MKNIFFLVFAFAIVSCNNSGKKIDPLEAKADSLQKEVIDGHNIAMPKSRKISGLQKQVQKRIDSISKLPKELWANNFYLIDLENVSKDLSKADSLMNKWMDEFNIDSFNNNAEQRVKYFLEEKNKIGKVKDAVLSSVQKADSLLKKGS